MEEFARHGFDWLGRPIELPGSRPLRFEYSQDLGSQLAEWPVSHCIKCLAFYHPDHPPALKAEQLEKLGGPSTHRERWGGNCWSRSLPARTEQSTI